MTTAALHLKVRGVVQGVGFRPFVHHLAQKHELNGWVRNTAGEVHIEVEGSPVDLHEFLDALTREGPPLARISNVETQALQPRGFTGFEIVPSTVDTAPPQPISPDAAICAACEVELFDPANRRYRYPFITCTDCGPRFTILEAVPFDRERTSMRAFRQCPECRREYEDPASRRHHSQTNCCFACGPRIWIEGWPVNEPNNVFREVARHLNAGAILALRGLGGFHLAVDARNESAVNRLRQRKHRNAKPLAVMVRTVEDAHRLGNVDPMEERLLVSRERPIVLLRRRFDCAIAPSVAPGLDRLGVMLASTPLHHLLLDAFGGPLVMTSGNRSEEPIAIGNAEATGRLRGIADMFLLHDREITARYDDSVVRVADRTPIMLRRARGYAPLPLTLPVPSPEPILAVGAQLKNTFTLAHLSQAFVSQHIGDLDDLDTAEHFLEAQRLHRRLFGIEPRIAVRDLHPEYASTRIAERIGTTKVVTVQHHHAHIAAVMGEHGVTHPVVGIAFDGAGYGDDDCIWGGEFLIADLRTYRRAAQLRYARLPGGDLGARRPWRSALAYLELEPARERAFRQALNGIQQRELELARHQIEARLNAPLMSSMGRLFDAAAAVLGVRQVSEYEGQAAMELEALASDHSGEVLPFPVTTQADRRVLDPVPLLETLGQRLAAGASPAHLAAAFHESVAAATASLALTLCREEQIDTVVLGGGVFQNARLMTSVARRLEIARIRVLKPVLLSPNDGCISYGQAVVAAARLTEEVRLCA